MKKRITLALAAVFAFALNSCSLGGSGLKKYQNEVEKKEYSEKLEEALKSYNYDDAKTFEADYEIKYIESEEATLSTKYLNDKNKVLTEIKKTDSSNEEVTYTYDKDSKTIHGVMATKENSKDSEGTDASTFNGETYIFEDGKEIVSVDQTTLTYTKAASLMDVAAYAKAIVTGALILNGGISSSEASYYVDKNVFTVAFEEKDVKEEIGGYEVVSSRLEAYQIIVEEGKITVYNVESSTSVSTKGKEVITSTKAYHESTVITLKDTKIKALDLKGYVEL